MSDHESSHREVRKREGDYQYSQGAGSDKWQMDGKNGMRRVGAEVFGVISLV